MKKRTWMKMGAIAVAASLIMAGCGSQSTEETTGTGGQEQEAAEAVETDAAAEEQEVGMTNPWVEITEEEAVANCNRLFRAPEGATVLGWSKLDGSEENSSVDKPLIQLEFEMDGKIFAARAQDGVEQDMEQNGLYVEWTDEEEVTLANWGGGQMPATIRRSVNDSGMVDLCAWYDIEIGINYTLSTAAEDLEGFDIQAVAEQMYNPDTEIFTGPDLSAGDYMTAIKNYLAEEVAAGYEEADYMIPEIYIVATDESVERDIKIWGDFWVMNYDADGDTLKAVSGGSYPGCFHVAKSDGVYDVTAFDVVADGSDYDSSAKEIFGEYYEDFVKLSSDDTGRNKERAKQISEYVKENGLSFTQYQDYGWDPVVLP